MWLSTPIRLHPRVTEFCLFCCCCCWISSGEARLRRAITARGLGARARPGRPDRPRPTHFDRLGRSSRSTSSPSHPESLRVARPSRFERPKSTEKVARAAPRRDFRRFLVDFGVDFRGFSLLTARALLESIFGSIFILFQGSLARVSRLASKGPTLEFIAMGSVS